MKRFYQSEDHYRSAHKKSFSGEIFTKPVVTVWLPDLLAEVHISIAGFTAAALVRHITIEGIGREFQTIGQALKEDSAYKWFVSKLAETCAIDPENQVTLPQFLEATYQSNVFETFEDSLMFINSVSKKYSKDIVRFYDKNEESIYINPGTNIILNKLK